MSSPALTVAQVHDAERRAADLDRADPLAGFVRRFLPSADPTLRAYLDGNSLGRPPIQAAVALDEFVRRVGAGETVGENDFASATLTDRVIAAVAADAAQPVRPLPSTGDPSAPVVVDPKSRVAGVLSSIRGKVRQGVRRVRKGVRV